MPQNFNPKRISSIDHFRGFAVALMIFVNVGRFFPYFPEFLKHAVGNGLTIADVIMPFFVFIVGASLFYSVQKHRKEKNYWFHFLKRFILLLILGLIFDSAVNFKVVIGWGVLQAIAFAAFIALFLLVLTNFEPVGLAIGFILAHQLMFFPVASLSMFSFAGWTFILLMGWLAADFLSKKENKKIYFYGLGIVLIGLLLNFTIIPFSTINFSSSTILFSTGLAFLLLGLFSEFFDNKKHNIQFLQDLGVVAFMAYILQAIFYLPSNFLQGFNQISMPLTIIYSILSVIIVWFLSKQLFKNGINLRI